MIIKQLDLFDIIARPDLAATSGSVLHVCCGYDRTNDCATTTGLVTLTDKDITSQFECRRSDTMSKSFAMKTNAQVMVIGKVLATGEILLYENNLNKAQQPKIP